MGVGGTRKEKQMIKKGGHKNSEHLILVLGGGLERERECEEGWIKKQFPPQFSIVAP